MWVFPLSLFINIGNLFGRMHKSIQLPFKFCLLDVIASGLALSFLRQLHDMSVKVLSHLDHLSRVNGSVGGTGLL